MTFTKTAIAAIAIAALSGPALAQSADTQFEERAAALTGDAAVITAWAEEVGGLQNGPAVNVVGLSELGDQGAEFNEFLDGVELEFAEFWGQIGAQPDIRSALEAEDYAAEDVVIFTQNGDDEVTVYVDDMM